MSNRRRMLMAIANQFKWLPYSYEYLYHDLVPVTIDGKSVKNKAKVSVIEANGAVENQLIQSLVNLVNNFGVVISNNDDGSLTFNGTATQTFDQMIAYGINVPQNHYVLVKTYQGGANYLKTWLQNAGSIVETYDESIIFKKTSSTNFTISFTLYSGKQYNFTFYPQVVDLTLMFGTGNEPTTLTDNRIQALLNRGYIPYNTGTYKGTDIGLFSSEPYNLFDGDIFNGYWNASTGVKTNDNGFRGSNDYIEVMPNCSYMLELEGNGNDYRSILGYDENKNFISRFATPSQNATAFTIPSNVKYITFYFSSSIYQGNVCLHRTGTRTGYTPYQSFTPIAFRYQGNGAINAHDTMTVTKDNVVFEKNVGSVDMGTLDWDYVGGSYTAYTQLSGAKTFIWSAIANVTAEKYATYKEDDITAQTKGISFANVLIVQDSSLGTSTAQVKAALSGQILHYELATPQTITIPRKHMKCVRIKDLTWTYNTSSGIGSHFYAILPDAKIVTSPASNMSNIYCCNYLTTVRQLNIFVNMCVCGDTDGSKEYVNIKDSRYTSASDFVDAMGELYIFYETQDEVADILDTLDIEAGGTVNANWFSWVENQIVYDGNFANGTNDWFCQGTIYSQSASNNIMTVTKNASGAGSVCSKSNSDITYDGTHKLLALAQIKPSRNCTMNFVVTDTQTGQSMTANVWNTLSYFVNPGSLHSLYFGIYETSNTLQVNDTVDIKNVMLIDLTQAFGAGNEPTDINDTRIQYIINKGYIPTNTTGTYKLVDCEVLPNVEFKMKCK